MAGGMFEENFRNPSSENSAATVKKSWQTPDKQTSANSAANGF
jgi:hypothetical protein